MNLLCTRMRHPSPIHRAFYFLFFPFFSRLSHGKGEYPLCTNRTVPSVEYQTRYTQVKVPSARARERERDARYLSHPRRIVEPSTERGVGRTMPSCVTTPGRLPVNAATRRIIIVVCTSFSCPSLGTLIFFGLNWCADNCAWVPRNGRSFSREIVARLIPFHTRTQMGKEMALDT